MAQDLVVVRKFMSKMNNIRILLFPLLIVSIMAASSADACKEWDPWCNLCDEFWSSSTSSDMECDFGNNFFDYYHCACAPKRCRKPYDRQKRTAQSSSEERPMLRSNIRNRRPNTLGETLDSIIGQLPTFPKLPKIPPMPSFNTDEKVEARGKTTGYSYVKEISTYQENDNPPEVTGYEIFEDLATGKKTVKKYKS